MKIISLVGSPHGPKGNTAQLLALVLDGAMRQGADTETFFSTGKNILPCMGCDACHRKGRCVQADDMDTLKQKIHDADGLILASPNYIHHVSAQMKAFMDRCCGILHCLGFEGKYGASVVTSGGGNEAPIADYMNHFLMCTGIQPVGSVWATMGNPDGGSLPVDIQHQASGLGEKLVLAWKAQSTFPDAAGEISAFKERMRTLVECRKDEWPFEYEYWQNRKKHGKT